MQDLFFSELFNRWFLFEKVIEALLAQDIFHRSLKQLQYYAEKECFIEDADDFAAMISFYHDLGMIIKHRETVVLKAQWLIDLLKQLITIPHYDKMVGKIYFIYIRSVSLEIDILEILYTPWPSQHHLILLVYMRVEDDMHYLTECHVASKEHSYRGMLVCGYTKNCKTLLIPSLHLSPDYLQHQCQTNVGNKRKAWRWFNAMKMTHLTFKSEI